MLGYTFNAAVLMLGVFFISISIMVFMIIVGANNTDKKYRLEKLYTHPMIEDILQQAPNEIVSLFQAAVHDTNNIDPYMLEYLEFYIHKAK